MRRAWFHDSHLAQAPGLTQAEWAGPGPHHAGTRAGMGSFGLFQFAPYIMTSRTLARQSSSEQTRERRSHLRRNALQVSERCRSWSLHGELFGDGSGELFVDVLVLFFHDGVYRARSKKIVGGGTDVRPVYGLEFVHGGYDGGRSRELAGNGASAYLCEDVLGLFRKFHYFVRPSRIVGVGTCALPEAWIVGVGTCVLPDDGLELFHADFPPEMLWHHPCGEQKIKGGRPDLLGREFGILAEQKRLIQRHLDLKEEMHLRHNKEIENAFISETRLARGVEQDLLGDCKKAVLVQQDQSGKEEESHQCLRQLQDVNGEQLVGVPKLGLPGAEENVACNNTASHKEFSEFPGPDIKFGSINIRDIPLLQGRQAAVILPNPQLDRRTSGLTPAGASSLDQETDQELNEKLL
ncbi:hypothetical protein OsJ_15359 [Oryza sativa Japonica Group]|uniref:Uncharacterized protein n=2 Tax=Oryza sativa subsp. japonica TaxID=39947 RepID=A0A8J8Y3A7_ORYSJ|nr:hypothetical protein OsJ_15359 [Oryza sativa Japonica Group]CAD41486.1 OSJNBa0029H02.29 [Oryza sativa Japonica Group]